MYNVECIMHNFGSPADLDYMVPLYTAGISPHEVRYHFTDISSVPQERISLKKPSRKTGFFRPLCGAPVCPVGYLPGIC